MTTIHDNTDHTATTDTDVTEVVVPGFFGRIADRIVARPIKSAICATVAVGASAGAGYIAYQQLRNGGDLTGAANTVHRTAAVVRSVLG